MEGSEIDKLPKLNWINGKSFIFLAACNVDDGSENVAQAFFKTQGVQSFFARAYSLFSNRHDKFDRVWAWKGDLEDDVYFLAFNRSDASSDPDAVGVKPGERILEGVLQ